MTKRGRTRQTPADMTGNELDFNLKRRKKNERKASNRDPVVKDTFLEESFEESFDDPFDDFSD